MGTKRLAKKALGQRQKSRDVDCETAKRPRQRGLWRLAVSQIDRVVWNELLAEPGDREEAADPRAAAQLIRQRNAAQGDAIARLKGVDQLLEPAHLRRCRFGLIEVANHADADAVRVDLREARGGGSRALF